MANGVGVIGNNNQVVENGRIVENEGQGVHPDEGQVQRVNDVMDRVANNIQRRDQADGANDVRAENVEQNEGVAHRSSSFLKKLLGGLAIAAGVVLLGAIGMSTMGFGAVALGVIATAVNGALGATAGTALLATAGVGALTAGLYATGAVEHFKVRDINAPLEGFEEQPVQNQAAEQNENLNNINMLEV